MAKVFKWSKEEEINFKSLLDQYQTSIAFEKHTEKYPFRTSHSMRGYMSKNKLHGKKPTYTKRKRDWTEEEKNYLIELADAHSRCECVELFQKRYDRSKCSIISMFTKTLHLKSNEQAKVKAIKERCGFNTRWKKLNVPYNHLPVGTVVERGKYRFIKVKDESVRNQGDCKENFMLLNRFVWEQNNGKIPSGYQVCFIDGDPSNCEIENLILVSGNQERQMLLNGDFLKHGREIAEIGSNICKLRIEIKKIEKKGNK